MLALLSDTTSVNESFGFVLTDTSFIQCSISIDYLVQDNTLIFDPSLLNLSNRSLITYPRIRGYILRVRSTTSSVNRSPFFDTSNT